jgi:hypothetical protein
MSKSCTRQESFSEILGADSHSEQVARAFCGALLTTPQFATTGVAPRDTCERPLLETDTYETRCEELAAVLESHGYELSCKGGKAHLITLGERLSDSLGPICPGGVCGWATHDLSDFCFDNPEACFDSGALTQDVRCVGLGCGGRELGDLSPDAPGAALAWLDGATATFVADVEVRRKNTWKTLAKGDQLMSGDWLKMYGGGALQLKLGKNSLGFAGDVPKRYSPTGNPIPWMLRVTGPDELASVTSVPTGTIPTAAIEAWQRLPAYRHGPGGGPRSLPAASK